MLCPGKAPSVAAPVVPGQVLGRAVLCLDGEEAASADLVALTPAPMYVEPEEEHGKWWLPHVVRDGKIQYGGDFDYEVQRRHMERTR